MKKILIGVCLMVRLVGFSQTSQDDFQLDAPGKETDLVSKKLWSTQYYIHEFQSGGTIPIVYANGELSGLYADTCDFCTASLEGTAFVKDSSGKITVINFAQTGDSSFVNCRWCSRFSSSKLPIESWGKTLWTKSQGFGDGVKNYRLIPFRTIAVDKAEIPYGSVVYIPAVKGKVILLPNGEEVIHDGYFFAGDTGGAIKRNHIDVFTGIYPGNPFPEVIKSNENKTFEAFIVSDEKIVKVLTDLHRK